ncbi:MAG: BTAD domain-containing putative transcriptional regulator [Gemmatimonadaceae bacterium]
MLKLRVLGALQLEGDEPGRGDDLQSQPKLLALLVFLAVARPRGLHQRDRLLGMFWPELDQERARAALRKAIHRCRQSLGEEVIESRGNDAIGLAPGHVWCDVVAFDEATREGRLAAALELYTGELLPGFYVQGAGTFETWLEDERARLRETAVDVAWRLVERTAADDEYTHAGRLARQVARLATGDERVVRKVMKMLERLGDRAGALDVYRQFAERLRRDYDAAPAGETVELVRSLTGEQRG